MSLFDKRQKAKELAESKFNFLMASSEMIFGEQPESMKRQKKKMFILGFVEGYMELK